jgi:AcrR family transcriptional regulator
MLPNSPEKLDPRTQRTRQLLLASFGELLPGQGFGGITVNDVAAKAGVNRATFYAHFADKYALLDTFIREEFRGEISSRMLNVCSFSEDNLHLLIITVCEFITRTHSNCASHEGQFQSLMEAQIREEVYGLLNHWLEGMDGSFANEITRQRAATAASWALYGLAHQWTHEKQKNPPGQFASEILPLVAANLGLTPIHAGSKG